MKKLFLVASILVLTAIQTPAQFTSSYGTVSTSLSTSSTGVVTGTPFAIQATYSSLISWQVVADGSALSVNLECSLDNVTYFIVDSQTTATGGLRNFGFSAVKFCRISQVSRTGGTVTNGSFVVTRGFITGNSTGNLQRVLVGDGTTSLPSLGFLSAPDIGFNKTASGLYINSGGIAQQRFAGSNFVINSLGSLGWSTSSDLTGADTFVGRLGAGQAYAGTSTVQPVINGTLFTYSGAAVCTIADVLETNLITYTLPAGALNANGRGLKITTWGNFAATANVKTIRVYLGATPIANSAVLSASPNNLPYSGIFNIVRTGAATQISMGNQGIGTSFLTNQAAPTETLSGTVVIKITGQNGTAAANDICATSMIVETIK